MRFSRDVAKVREILNTRQWQSRVRSLDLRSFPAFFERWNRTHAWPISVSWDAETNTLRVRDNADPAVAVHVSRASRVSLYRRGVSHRLKFLWDEYLAGMVGLDRGDVVIDVGANVGEFSLEANRRGARTYSFEPDPTEFRSLRANLPHGDVFNQALWCERKTMTFYSKNASGDSSLIEMDDYSSKIDVEAVTLDEVHRTQMQGHPVKLIKLEAEGAEPEIISAAPETLSVTRFVSVDAGPERGLTKDNTVVPVLNALQDLGFQLIGFGSPRHVMLFSRRA